MDNTHPLRCETPTNAYVCAHTHTHTNTHGDATAWALNVITLTSPQPSVTLHNPSCFGYLNTPCTPHMCTHTVGVINMHAETETDALLTVWGHNNQQSSVVNPRDTPASDPTQTHRILLMSSTLIIFTTSTPGGAEHSNHIIGVHIHSLPDHQWIKHLLVFLGCGRWLSQFVMSL